MSTQFALAKVYFVERNPEMTFVVFWLKELTKFLDIFLMPGPQKMNIILQTKINAVRLITHRYLMDGGKIITESDITFMYEAYTETLACLDPNFRPKDREQLQKCIVLWTFFSTIDIRSEFGFNNFYLPTQQQNLNVPRVSLREVTTKVLFTIFKIYIPVSSTEYNEQHLKLLDAVQKERHYVFTDALIPHLKIDAVSDIVISYLKSNPSYMSPYM
jgi:hypothetical protein